MRPRGRALMAVQGVNDVNRFLPNNYDWGILIKINIWMIARLPLPVAWSSVDAWWSSKRLSLSAQQIKLIGRISSSVILIRVWSRRLHSVESTQFKRIPPLSASWTAQLNAPPKRLNCNLISLLSLDDCLFNDCPIKKKPELLVFYLTTLGSWTPWFFAFLLRSPY